jgi:hypothetical protein
VRKSRIQTCLASGACPGCVGVSQTGPGETSSGPLASRRLVGSPEKRQCSASERKVGRGAARLTICARIISDAAIQRLAVRKRWEFMLTTAPLAIRRGTGSPVNPIATF